MSRYLMDHEGAAPPSPPHEGAAGTDCIILTELRVAGLFVGSSAALNCAAVPQLFGASLVLYLIVRLSFQLVKVARQIGKGKVNALKYNYLAFGARQCLWT